jgi:hypothetical protein
MLIGAQILDRNAALMFHLQQQHLIELIRKGSTPVCWLATL